MESSVSQKVILVADDEPAIAMALEEYFRLKGHEVMKAFDGDQALEQAKIKRPALVVLDLRMPRMDGISVLQEIRSSYPETRTLVITGQADHYRKDLECLRPDKVMVKPVSLEELAGKLCRDWEWGAVAQRRGHRGRALQILRRAA